ncbi:MAG: radical SAM protein [Candidatus Yonathbacteria bacterium]|nr:radical SAM protein [Candidatus Yonathbacteria bacterium]
MTHADTTTTEVDVQYPIDFLWLELTNQCNLQCVHCYAESSPRTGHSDILLLADYERLIDEARALGCKKIQFIGGEPTLNQDLECLIVRAVSVGYLFIEVFTNLTHLPQKLLACFKNYGVRVATSIYAPTEDVHDRITQVNGSFNKTIRNLQRLLDASVSVRVGVINMKQNSDLIDATTQFLKNKGIKDVGIDCLRLFGRGRTGGKGDLQELCGACASGTLCIAPDGRVSPCIMSKDWSIGSVLETPLVDIVESEKLRSLRRDIYRTVVEPREVSDASNHGNGNTISVCDPHCPPYCEPACSPRCGPTCDPISCNPRSCWPAMCNPT